MFCPNCGKKCAEGALFCWNCGAKLPAGRSAVPAAHESAPVVTQTHTAQPVIESEPGIAAECPVPVETGARASISKAAVECVAEGVIFTNLRALAGKLSTDVETVRKLLLAYAEASLAQGIHYHLVDVADYHFLNPEAAKNRVLRLSPTDSWVEHCTILADYYRFGRNTQEERTDYLFIIGGGDIIPMPVVPHYLSNPNFSDKDIDTDIPYAYLLGERTYPMLRSGGIFGFEQYFHVGRLPFGEDASMDDLAGYLRRAARVGGGFALRRYYGQANLPWCDDSLVVCEPLRASGLVTSADDYESPAARDGLFVSPPVVWQNTGQVFDQRADLYYFNLHGSDAPTTAGFIADDSDGAYLAIDPACFATVDTPNLFVTEACYGAKFLGLRRTESMLLTAMSGETLLYFGSSRIAFCNNRYNIDNSDRLTRVYIEALLAGFTAGEALYLARSSFFEYDNGRLYDQQQTTIVEFNLFGDPYLCVAAPQGRSKTKSPPAGRKVLTRKPVYTVTERKCLYKAAADGAISLLEQVRGSVDRNLAAIRETVNRELYARLGVEPRALSAIFENRFADGGQFLSFDYARNRSGREELHVAITDMKGNIKTIVSTK